MKKLQNSSQILSRLLVYCIIFITSICILHLLTIDHDSSSCNHQNLRRNHIISSSKLSNINNIVSNTKTSLSLQSNPLYTSKTLEANETTLHHIAFGIGASSKFWDRRKEFIKLWWRPNQTRGYVWLDKPLDNVKVEEDNQNYYHLLPPIKISSDTSKFKYYNRKGDRSAIRISRIVSETFRLGMEDVRWFVMGDDDTMFVVDNLVRVLQKYDHNEFYYIGSSSESHTQNIYFSYNMAYGGGGFAISYPLAKALEKIQDDCIQRSPGLYGSDDRIQACMAELGVPLTKEIGFHQLDVYGNIFGLLAAHPVTPLVSLHHLDIIDPIFPNMKQIEALERLKAPMKLDSAGLMQQSMCYDKSRKMTISVSWGYVVQIFTGLVSARELEIPARTFMSWYRKSDESGFSFNTRGLAKNSCERASVYVFTNAIYNTLTNETASEYVKHVGKDQWKCKEKVVDSSLIQRVVVYKEPDPHLWDKAPRRNCCRILHSEKPNTMVVNVGGCHEDETMGR
ncbi:UDP-glucose flavonoid 3-O-glucosyltransferase 7-like [Heracleum sosnowskyi]|uniref:UDP-glucose flavonoid 3-O-glucosyltransferase 7-like n=1 Tax=Heracleum sosnowskyi TaxID=360622 RepID=A0AAD8GWT7_9APIA|nr:UDP-glucose flavonoid 3-O-glucosyltransferase 7-like [Heracleum sosnowskyi]